MLYKLNKNHEDINNILKIKKRRSYGFDDNLL